MLQHCSTRLSICLIHKKYNFFLIYIKTNYINTTQVVNVSIFETLQLKTFSGKLKTGFCQYVIYKFRMHDRCVMYGLLFMVRDTIGTEDYPAVISCYNHSVSVILPLQFPLCIIQMKTIISLFEPKIIRKQLKT